MKVNLRFSLGILVLSLLAAPAAFAASQEEIEKSLFTIDVLRAQFQQTRYVAGLESPLESSGKLLFAKDLGLVWIQEEPFEAEFVFTEEAVSEKFGTQDRIVKHRQGNEELFKMIGLLRSYLKGDQAPLQKAFEVEFAETGNDRWVFFMTPKIRRISKAFSSIALSGTMLIDTVVIREASGNRSVIEFKNLYSTPSTLSIDERQYFKN